MLFSLNYIKFSTIRLKKHSIKICLVIIFILIGILIFNKRKTHNIIRRMYNETALDIMDDVLPPNGLIFFINTSFNSSTPVYMELKFRQACTVESTARAHPNSTIYILYTSPVRYPDEQLLSTKKYTAIKQVLKLSNVYIRSINLFRFVKGTPVEELVTSGRLQKSQFPKVHLSDIIRLIVLWKYGGTYLDLDMVMKKSLYDLGTNFLGIESLRDKNDLVNGVMSLENYGVGREITEECLRNIQKHFDPESWAGNGPYLITRVIKEICNNHNISTINESNCRGFHPVPYWVFYPFNWDEWKVLFKPDNFETLLEQVQRSYAVHLYSHDSDRTVVVKNKSQVLYGALAKEYCPDCYANSGDTI